MPHASPKALVKAARRSPGAPLNNSTGPALPPWRMVKNVTGFSYRIIDRKKQRKRLMQTLARQQRAAHAPARGTDKQETA